MKREEKKQKNSEGITLIALVITIIVLLILAGVSISMLTGENGLLTKASGAKVKTIEGAEKEKVKVSYMASFADSLGTNVSKAKVQEELDKLEGVGKTQVTGSGNNIKVKFTETNNKYLIKDGNVEKYVPAELTDVFVALYTDETLVFSNNEADIDSSKVKINYGNIKNKSFEFECPWYANTEQILKVDIINKIVPSNIDYWFAGMEKVTKIENLDNINTENLTTMVGAFLATGIKGTLDLSIWDTSNVKLMSRLFMGSLDITEINISGWDTSNVTNMTTMFSSGYPTTIMKLERIIGIEDLDTSKVTDMSMLFWGCGKLQSLDLSKWNTSNVTNMNGMFLECDILNNLNILGFDTKNVEDMSYMFADCRELTEINLSSFNTSKVVNMNNMFGPAQEWLNSGNSKLKKVIGLENFDTSSVENMNFMFYKCPDLTWNCSNWNVDKVKEHDKFNEGSPNVTPPKWKQ